MTNQVFALMGKTTKDLLSYNGQVLVHWDKDELQYLFPKATIRKVNKLPDNWMHIGDHPQLKGVVEFPLKKSDFHAS